MYIGTIAGSNRATPEGSKNVARGGAKRNPWFAREHLIPPRRGGGLRRGLLLRPSGAGDAHGGTFPGVPLRSPPGYGP